MYVIPTMNVGGAETLLAAQLPLLVQAGVEPLLVTMRPQTVVLDRANLDVRCLSLDLGPGRGWLGGLLLSRRFSARLRELIRVERPDLVHLNLYLTDAWGRLAARKYAPTVTTWHSCDPWMSSPSLNNRVRVLVERRTLAAEDAYVIAVSAAAREWGRSRLRVPEQRVRVIFNGLDLNHFISARPIRDNRPPRVVMVARFRPEKGQDIALRALRLARDSGAEFQADFLGDGPSWEAMRALSAELGLDDCVRFPGVCHEIARVLPQYDLALLTSRQEGLGMAAAEASASFVPIVATRIGGLPEVVVHEETGLIVEPESPRAVAAAICRLLSDDTLRLQMAENGRRHVEAHFNLAHTVPEMVSFYREIIAKGVV